MKKVNTFIVGAPKSGTTALASYLDKHLDVIVSKPKEPHYFASDMENYKAVINQDDYHDLFENGKSFHCRIDASVWYLYSETAIKNIKEYNPHAKILVMLRSPVDMVYSMHSQHLYSMDEHIVDFKEAWRLGLKFGESREVNKHTRCVKNLMYHKIARYGEQLERLYSSFPSKQIKVILFDEFKLDTKNVYKETLEFLELLDNSETIEFCVVNPNTVHKNRQVANFIKNPPIFLRKFHGFLKARNFELIFLRDYIRSINTSVENRVQLDERLKIEIIDEYKSDIKLLESIIQKDLNGWVI